MTRTKKEAALRARLRRAIAHKLAKQQLAARRSHIAEILLQVEEIISEDQFVALLVGQGIKTAPSCLFKRDKKVSNDMTDAEIADSVLTFVVAWKFIFPLLSSSKISAYLEHTRPGFIADLKDTFIMLVMDGPFPSERRPAVRPTYFS